MNIIAIMLPIILLIFTGWLLAKIGFFNETIEVYLAKIVLNLAVPALIFVSINSNSIKNILNFEFLFAYLLSIAITFIIAICFFAMTKKPATTEMIFIAINSSISNSGLIALPILLGIFSTKGVLPIVIILTVSSIVVVPLIVLFIEYQLQGQQVNKLALFSQAIWKTFRQPFILATIIALLFNIFSLPIPAFIYTYLNYIANITIPCALMAVGIKLYYANIFSFKLDIFYITFLNLIIKPIIAIGLAFIFHLSNLYSIALIVVSAAPIANMVYLLAANYNVYKSESAACLSLTTIVSIFTLPVFLWIAFNFCHFK